MKTISGTIFNIMRFAVNDGPGIRTTVFFKGCPLRCVWCHNPESIAPLSELLLRPERCIGCGACLLACPNQAIEQTAGVLVTDRRLCRRCGACVAVCATQARAMVGERMSVDDVMREVEKDIIFYRQSGGGVTLSGGEPLAQPEFAAALLQACRQKNIHTVLDTSGYAPLAVLQDIHKYVDLYLFDLKTPDEADHKKYTGVSLEPILTNLQWLCRNGAKIILRVPILPGLNDAPERLDRIGRLAAAQKSIEEIQLLPYHRSGADKYRRLGSDDAFIDLKPPSRENMGEIAAGLQKYVQSVTIGG